MGLFSNVPRFGGVFYRRFSQELGCLDIDTFFGKDSIAQSGICAGCTLNWIRHYLLNNTYYNNDIISRDKHDIETIQGALRYRDQALSSFLIEKVIMVVRPFHFKKKPISSIEARDISHLTCVSHGVSIFTYNHRSHGRHVVAAYVDPSKRLYFIDTNKGDVSIPYPGSIDWLHSYLDLFLMDVKDFQVTHFAPYWNEDIFQKCLIELAAYSNKALQQNAYGVC